MDHIYLYPRLKSPVNHIIHFKRRKLINDTTYFFLLFVVAFDTEIFLELNCALKRTLKSTPIVFKLKLY